MERRTFAGFLGRAAAALVGGGLALNSFTDGPGWRVWAEWNMVNLTSKTGKSLLQALVDVDGDGQRELIANVGAQAHFVCCDQNQNLVWENVQDTTQHKRAYYPKIADDALFYGDRNSNTLYCVNLSDGSLRWSRSPYTGLEAVDICDHGVVFGGDTLAVLDYTTGSEVWSATFDTREQVVASGDLDGDGTDEVVAGNSSGTLTVRNNDGSEAFQIVSDVNHYDLVTIGDIDGSRAGMELLTVVNDNSLSTLNEGNELATFDSTGQKLNSYTTGEGVNYAVGNFEPDKNGLEVAFGVEGTTMVGDWTVHYPNSGREASIVICRILPGR